ncbi:MAG: 4Fe-4S dicluster domain-containing protein, partial [Muribaculaceae bacterium]|nr:4Fe-4S dicluster domain-containing protein [Muribaculaceae bacterium]
HEVLRRHLAPAAQLLADEGFSARICIDTAPVLERYWAVKGGIGFIGRNRQLIVPGMGSYFFLAEIITSAEIEPDTPCALTCGNCGKCVEACPGGALDAPDGFDATSCLSYLTIEHRGELPAATGKGCKSRPIAEALGNRVYGCDECQRVCPHNADPPVTGIAEFRMRPALRGITRAGILDMTQQQFSTIFSHSAVKRAKLAGLQRNAAATTPSPAQSGPEGYEREDVK